MPTQRFLNTKSLKNKVHIIPKKSTLEIQTLFNKHSWRWWHPKQTKHDTPMKELNSEVKKKCYTLYISRNLRNVIMNK